MLGVVLDLSIPDFCTLTYFDSRLIFQVKDGSALSRIMVKTVNEYLSYSLFITHFYSWNITYFDTELDSQVTKHAFHSIILHMSIT